MSVFSELRRRNIFRVALLYIASTWLVIELGAFLVDHMGLTEWIFKFICAILFIGFPLALVLSWIYEITPEGIRREREVPRHESITRVTGRKILRMIGACLLGIVLINLARFAFS